MYLVFDVGATFVKYAWMSEEGDIEEKGKIPTRNKPGDGVEEFLSSLVEIYEAYKAKGEVEGIALGMPGQIDVENGIIYGGGGLMFLDQVHFGQLLSESCDNVKVSLENDAKCAALAEVWLGNAKDCENACVMVFGSGIGGGIIINRRVYRGNRLLAGEISYGFDKITRENVDDIVPIESLSSFDEGFEKLPYIWSTNTSARALSYKVAAAKGLPCEEVNGELIYKWAEEGDEVVNNILEDCYLDIAKYCCTLYVTLDPDVILIGGGISAQPAFIAGIKKYVEKLIRLGKVYRGIKIDVCKFRNDSNLYGALYNFKQKYGLID